MKKLIAVVGDNAHKGKVAPEMNSQEWMDAINRELSTIVNNAGITVEDDNNEEALYAALSRLLRRAGE